MGSKGVTGKLVFAVCAAAIGSAFQHGYNTGVVNAPQKLIEKWIEEVQTNRSSKPKQSTITLIWSLAVSIYCVGGIIGAAVSGILADKFGRKGTLLFNNIFILIAAALLGLAKMCKSYEMIIAGRLVLGVNSGINAGITPLYLMEISPQNIRGAIGTVYQLIITISILISQILGLGSILGSTGLWPILLALIIVPAIFQVLTLPCCPESPRFLLIIKAKDSDAQKALVWLRNDTDVQDEMTQIKTESDQIKALPKVKSSDLCKDPLLRLPFIISIVMMLAQQLSGINAVIFYSTKIFVSAKITETNAQYATIGMGTVNVLMTIVSLFLVEMAGRRTLLLVGYIGMFFDTILLMLALLFVDEARAISYICIGLVMLYIVFFATGPGSIPWFLVSEMFSSAARPAAQAIAVTVNWAANFVVALGFSPIQELVGAYVFIAFIVCLGLTVFFILRKVPETKDKSLDEVIAEFKKQIG